MSPRIRFQSGAKGKAIFKKKKETNVLFINVLLLSYGRQKVRKQKEKVETLSLRFFFFIFFLGGGSMFIYFIYYIYFLITRLWVLFTIRTASHRIFTQTRVQPGEIGFRHPHQPPPMTYRL